MTQDVLQLFTPVYEKVKPAFDDPEPTLVLKLCLFLSTCYSNFGDTELMAPCAAVEAAWQKLVLRPRLYEVACREVYETTRARVLETGNVWGIKAYPGVVDFDPTLSDGDALPLRRKFGATRMAVHMKTLFGREYHGRARPPLNVRAQLMHAVNFHQSKGSLVVVYVRDHNGRTPCAHCNLDAPLILTDLSDRLNTTALSLQCMIAKEYDIALGCQRLYTEDGRMLEPLEQVQLGDTLILRLAPIKFTVKTLRNDSFEVLVSPAKCVVDLKKQLADRVSLDPADQRVIFKTKELNLGSLYQLGVHEGSTLYIVGANVAKTAI